MHVLLLQQSAQQREHKKQMLELYRRIKTAAEKEDAEERWRIQMEERGRRARTPHFANWTDRDDPDIYLRQFEMHMSTHRTEWLQRLVPESHDYLPDQRQARGCRKLRYSQRNTASSTRTDSGGLHKRILNHATNAWRICNRPECP